VKYNDDVESDDQYERLDNSGSDNHHQDHAQPQEHKPSQCEIQEGENELPVLVEERPSSVKEQEEPKEPKLLEKEEERRGSEIGSPQARKSFCDGR
jgi:hypothetical protein